MFYHKIFCVTYALVIALVFACNLQAAMPAGTASVAETGSAASSRSLSSTSFVAAPIVTALAGDEKKNSMQVSEPWKIEPGDWNAIIETKNSAAQGNDVALSALGFHYWCGSFEPDLIKAIRCFEQAVAHATGEYKKDTQETLGMLCYDLGLRYARADVMSKDVDLAIFWLRKAAECGFVGAQKAIDTIEGVGNDNGENP